MRKNIPFYVGMLASLFLVGCAGHHRVPPNPGPEFAVEVSANDVDPNGANQKKVVIFEVSDGGNDTAKKAGLSSPIVSTLNAKITDAGGYLVDRSLAQKLKEEIKRAEMGGSGAYAGAPIADYAVRSRITQAAFGSEFEEAYRWKDRNGEVHVEPPVCNYRAEVSITVDVYTVPELIRIKTLRGDGAESASEETRTSYCSASGDNLLRAAAAETVIDMQGELQGFFAPVGYVTKAHEFGEEYVAFKTTLTTQLGARPGASVQIYDVLPNGDRFQVAEGEIAEPVYGSGAFVVVERKHAKSIKIGNEVKLDFGCSFLGCKFDNSTAQLFN